MPIASNPDNILLGKGKLYFDQFTVNTTNKTGELDLGEVESLELKVDVEKKEKITCRDGSGDKIASAATSKKYSGTIKGCEFNKENLAILCQGDVTTISQTGATVTDEQVTASAVQGRYYPCAKRSISAVSVKSGAAGSETSKTLTTDYTIDATTGRIYIVPGGGIAAGHSVLVSYTYATIALPAINCGSRNSVEGYLRFVGDPAEGPKLELEVWHAKFDPASLANLIADDWATWDLNYEALAEKTAHPSCPVYRLICHSETA